MTINSGVGGAVRFTTHVDGTESEQVRHDILSDVMSASRFAQTVRGHRPLEAMHWGLGVTLGEDQIRSAERTLANNCGWLQRFAIAMLRRHPLKDCLCGKMQSCMYNPDFHSEVPVHQTLVDALALWRLLWTGYVGCGWQILRWWNNIPFNSRCFQK